MRNDGNVIGMNDYYSSGPRDDGYDDSYDADADADGVDCPNCDEPGYVKEDGCRLCRFNENDEAEDGGDEGGDAV